MSFVRRSAPKTAEDGAAVCLARDAPVSDFHGLAVADRREARVTEFGCPVARIRPNPVGHLAKSPSGLAKRKA